MAVNVENRSSRPRILVVEDSVTVRRVVARTLERAGYEVLVAEDGRQGLEQAQRHVPDLVLADQVMPHMDGTAFCEALRDIANLRDVRVVLMTAKPDQTGDDIMERTGAVDAIRKPFGPEALLAVTTHALTRPGSPTGADGPVSSGPGRARVFREEGDGVLDDATDGALQRAAAQIGEIVADALHQSQRTTLSAASVGDALLGRGEQLRALVEALEAPQLDPDTALAGRLGQVSLGDALQLLQHQRQTGVLEVTPSRGIIPPRPAPRPAPVRIFMREGLIDIALAPDSDPEFRLGRYLIQEGFVEREDIDILLQRRVGSERRLLGTLLVKLGYITSDDLQQALVRQTSELIYEALRWTQGHFRLTRFAERPHQAEARLGLPITSVLMEGLRRVDEWRLIEEQIRDFDQVLAPDPAAVAMTDTDRLSTEERTVLHATDGKRTVRDIIDHTNLGSFETCKILFQLRTSHLVKES